MQGSRHSKPVLRFVVCYLKSYGNFYPKLSRHEPAVTNVLALLDQGLPVLWKNGILKSRNTYQICVLVLSVLVLVGAFYF